MQIKKTKKFANSKIILYILIVVFFLFAINFARAYYQNFQVRQEIKQLEKDVQGLETKKIESINILKYVASDAYVEETARTELNLKKSGEKVLILNTELLNHKAKEGEAKNLLANPKKWFYYFLTHELPKKT